MIPSQTKLIDEKVTSQLLKKRNRLGERFIESTLVFCGFISIFITLGIVFELGKEALPFFSSTDFKLIKFLTGTTWQPQIKLFGVLPLVMATLTTTVIALLIAIPFGIGIAIYLSEYASVKLRSTIKPTLEILAGIPTVVYGYFALSFVTPFLRVLFGKDVVEIYNTASAGIVMGILILPLIASMSEDALAAVPRSLREAAYGLGATKIETTFRVVIPAAISGLAAAIIVGISRAIGETMIVALAAGAGPKFTFNPFQGAETMTGHIVRVSGGDLSYDSIDYNSLFGISLLLFFMTLSLNMLSQWVVRKLSEVK
jgi:phosphate transport system permease protein